VSTINQLNTGTRPTAGAGLAPQIEDEIEAKFVVRSADEAEQLLRVVGQFAELTAQDTEQVVDDYIDSPTLELYTTGLGCRIRQKIAKLGAIRWSLECKAIAHGGESIKTRKETRHPLPGPVTPDDLPAGAVRNLLDQALTSPPAVILRLHNQRQHYLAKTGLLNEFDVCMDVVEVKSPDGRLLGQFREVEIELVRGEYADLQALIGQVQAAISLSQSRLGKFERSLWLTRTRLDRTETWQPAQPAWSLLVAQMRHDLRMIGLSRAIALEGSNPEGVHLVRTHTRKLQAALAAAVPWLGRDSEQLNREFRELASSLSEVRDLDVYSGQTMALVKTLPEVRARVVTQLEQALKELLAQAQCKSRAQLERPGLDRLIERFSKLLEDKIDEHPEITIQDLARTDLIRVAGKVRKSIRKLGDADSDDALHLLRIRFKKLRYALELYAVVISDELRVATRQARAIQDLLGTHQDACVAVAHGQRLAAQLPLIPQNREVLVTLGRLQSERERQATKIRRSFLSGSTAAGNAGREFSRLLKRALKTL